MCDFSVTVDGCKFCTVKDKNFKFSESAELLVHCNAYRKEHLIVHDGWTGNAKKMSQIYLFLESPSKLSNSEVVMLEPYVELTQNDPTAYSTEHN